ncbi:unnamed protein product [Moneuplotes crassus]|uniref:Uncharacterized protein n=1 Tax=Euplotes crassus TaxID=5936 RepID=A0AAD1XZG0_EUPCR|nr:unnamed protein product [Moneuplotes crassus]
MFVKDDQRDRCFRIWKCVHIVVMVLVITGCGVVNYWSGICVGSDCIGYTLGYHLVFVFPSIIFHILERRVLACSYIRINTLVALISMFYLCVMMWALMTLLKINNTEDLDSKEKSNFFLFHYLIPECVVATPFLIIALFYVTNNSEQNERDIEAGIEMPIMHPPSLSPARILRQQNRTF